MKKYFLISIFLLTVVNLFSADIYYVSEVEIYKNIGEMYSDIGTVLGEDITSADLFIDNHHLVIETYNDPILSQDSMIIIDWFPNGYKYDVRVLTVEKDEQVYNLVLKKKDGINDDIEYLTSLVKKISSTERTTEKQYFSLLSNLRSRGIYYDPGVLWNSRSIYNVNKPRSYFDQAYTLLGLYLLNKETNRDYAKIYLNKLLEHTNINSYLIDFSRYAGFDRYNFNTSRSERGNKISFNYEKNQVVINLLESDVDVDFGAVEDYYSDLSLFMKDRNRDIIYYNLAVLSDIKNIPENIYANKIKSDDLVKKYKVFSIDKLSESFDISSENRVFEEIVNLEVEILGEILKLEVKNEI